MVASVSRGVAAVVLLEVVGHIGWPARKIDINAASVGLGGELEAQFAADLLDARFDFLDVVRGVVSFTYDAVFFIPERGWISGNARVFFFSFFFSFLLEERVESL